MLSESKIVGNLVKSRSGHHKVDNFSKLFQKLLEFIEIRINAPSENIFIDIEAVHTLVLGVHKDVGCALTGIKGGTHYQVFETISIEVDRC
jgi:hypothetical protein